MADEFELVFYRKKNGDCPVASFIASLNKEMRYKMMRCLDKVEYQGNTPRSDVTKHVGDGIFEVRAQNKTDISRIFFFFDKNKQIVLTNGFIKKTQRMPDSDFEVAKRYRNDYYAREKEREAEARKRKEPAIVTSGPKWRPKLDQIIEGIEAGKTGRTDGTVVQVRVRDQLR